MLPQTSGEESSSLYSDSNLSCQRFKRFRYNSIDSLCAENSSVSSEPISFAAIDSNYIGNNPHCSTSSDQHTCVDSPLPESPYSRSEYPRTQSNEEDSTDKSVSIITKEHKLLTGIVQWFRFNNCLITMIQKMTKEKKKLQRSFTCTLKIRIQRSWI
ncbi:hypothetical protein Bca4012_075593 [Brassica carinata]|uniref:Uncharacterized protein n=1 Tax=Brassica carinata TaxID=52824 RepID=A0A8X7QB70_BRACI|nr:hypothetical protein Bca52824_074011 [Brassica carinata]